MKIVLIWLMMFCTLAYGDAVIFSGTDVKALKANIQLFDQAKIMSGTVDPSSSATSANKGSIYLNTSSGLTYRKTDNGSSTNWSSYNSTNLPGPRDIINCSLAASVGSSALTIALKDAGGSDASGGSPCAASFRSATAATGTFSVLTISAALSIVVPSTATLGHTNGTDRYVWVYLANDSGTARLCVSGVDIFDDGVPNAFTAVSTGSTSGAALYCNSSSGTVATRLIGRILVNQATAGTWASAPTRIENGVIPRRTTIKWTAFTPTLSVGAPNGGAANQAAWMRDGSEMLIRWHYKQTSAGTAGSGNYYFLIPNSKALDTTVIDPTTVMPLGLFRVTNVADNKGNSTIDGYMYAVDSTHIGAMVNILASGTYDQKVTEWASGGSFPFSTAQLGFSFNIRIPIAGWSEYGP